jgi:hypothetical protein
MRYIFANPDFASEDDALDYPNLRTFSPFSKWNASAATKSIPWYDAYNQTKHNRERDFGVATLENAIDAVVAAVIVFYAQFGRCDKGHGSAIFPRFETFLTYQSPEYSVDEWYLFCQGGKPLEAVPYRF